ncbi:EndoU domain-containing protein [Nocardia fluminea]|uniref:EndoU domain-containing protein n=1 Tax=Nocardia fluminea TaxID=134984 RepID=UPI003409AEB3
MAPSDKEVSVTPKTFYDAGTDCINAAGAFDAFFTLAMGGLIECEKMGGSFAAASDWSRSYDDRASELTALAANLVSALSNYSNIVTNLGYVHALADNNPNNDDPPKALPILKGLVHISPPSAGGPGNGLVDKLGVGLIEQLGVSVPDGNIERLDLARIVWETMATGDVIVANIDKLQKLPGTFEDQKSDDATAVMEDLKQLHSAAIDLQHACSELAGSCRDHRAALIQLRDDITRVIEDVAKDAGVTVLVEVGAAALILVGRTDAAAKLSADRVKNMADGIGKVVVEWNNTKGIAAGVKKSRDLGPARTNLQRIIDLEQSSVSKSTNGLGNQWSKVTGPVPSSISITQGRRIHILDGDGSDDVNSGGHAPGTGIPGKTEFPDDEKVWDDDQIIDRALDVAKNPDQPPVLQNNGRWACIGTRNGVEIKVIVDSNGNVVTAYPLGGTGVTRNDEQGNPQPIN